MVQPLVQYETEDSIARFREVFELEEATGRLTWKVGPLKGREAGTFDSSNGYRKVTIDRYRWYEHRVIFAMVNGFFPAEVDHINGHRTDNRPENLRAADRALNASNLLAHNECGVKHVYKSPVGRFFVQCGIDGRIEYAGTYDTIQEAVDARNAFLEERGLTHRIARELALNNTSKHV